jgi:hypothetical protein
MMLHGIKFDIDWHKFKPNTTFWIPCLNTQETKAMLRAEILRRKMRCVVKVSVENGILGVRVWRRSNTPSLDTPPKQQ